MSQLVPRVSLYGPISLHVLLFIHPVYHNFTSCTLHIFARELLLRRSNRFCVRAGIAVAIKTVNGLQEVALGLSRSLRLEQVAQLQKVQLQINQCQRMKLTVTSTSHKLMSIYTKAWVTWSHGSFHVPPYSNLMKDGRSAGLRQRLGAVSPS